MSMHFEFERITVTWDAPSSAAMIVFNGYVEGEVLRAALDKVLEILVVNRSSRLISDTRNMKALTQADQGWIDEDWRPRARAAGLRLNAVLLPASTIAKLSVAAVVRKVPAEATQFAYFSEIDQARAWLKGA
jgi:hypothetical protein